MVGANTSGKHVAPSVWLPAPPVGQSLSQRARAWEELLQPPRLSTVLLAPGRAFLGWPVFAQLALHGGVDVPAQRQWTEGDESVKNIFINSQLLSFSSHLLSDVTLQTMYVRGVECFPS